MYCACVKFPVLINQSSFKFCFVQPVRTFILKKKWISKCFLHQTEASIKFENKNSSNLFKSCSAFYQSVNCSRKFSSHCNVLKLNKSYYRLRLFSLSHKVLRSSNYQSHANQNVTSLVLYFSSMVIVMIGLSYAAVPLYRLFCQATGLGGDPTIGHKIGLLETMEPIRERRIKVSFNADHHSSMQWNFKPAQSEVTVVPGETALAFYTAKNPTNEPIVGIATYNVIPFQAGLYFNKIQCFCFEEQWLNPNEEVDMPVFFYIDPDYDDDPQLAKTDSIVLSYTFFKAVEGQTLPLPGFMKANSVVNLNDTAQKATS